MDWPLVALCGLLLMLAGWPLLSAGFVYEDANHLTIFPGWNWRPNRFLSELTWWLQIGQSARAYHVVNLLVHAVNAVLVACLARVWRISMFAGGLFLLHPLPLFAAGYLQGRPDLLMTLGCLVAVLGCQGGKPAIAMLGTAIAVTSKESGVVVLPLLLLVGRPWVLLLAGLALCLGTWALVASLWTQAQVTPLAWASIQASACLGHLWTWLTVGRDLTMLAPSAMYGWALPALAGLSVFGLWLAPLPTLWIALAFGVRCLVPTIGTPIVAHQMYSASVGLALLTASVGRVAPGLSWTRR